MDYQRSERVGDLLIEVISDLLRKEIRDPRIQAVTLTRAKVTKDLKHARIYVSFLGAQEQKSAALAGLRSASGFIRSKLGKHIKLRFIPTIEFVYDDAEDEARRIDDLLDRVKEKS